MIDNHVQGRRGYGEQEHQRERGPFERKTDGFNVGDDARREQQVDDAERQPSGRDDGSCAAVRGFTRTVHDAHSLHSIAVTPSNRPRKDPDEEYRSVRALGRPLPKWA
jgi:hypothetical protein